MEATQVKANDGSTAYTSKAYKTYFTELKLRVKTEPVVKTIDVSPTGVVKPGTIYMDISKAINDIEPHGIDPHVMLSNVNHKLLSNSIIKRIIA